MADDKLAGIEAAADRIRQTAKWLTVSLAAVGGVLIAGTQLSDIGQLQAWSSRFVVAIVGGGVAAAAAVIILALAIWVAVTPAISLTQLAAKEPKGVRDIVRDPIFLGGKKSVSELNEAYKKALLDREEAFHRLSLQDNATNQSAAVKTDREMVSVSNTVSSLMPVVAYERVAYRWKWAGAVVLICGLVAAAGVGAFAWAAHPPDKVKASMLSPAVLAMPTPVSVTLTAEGQKALRSALGPQCPLASPLAALDLGNTDAGPDVLIQQKGCNTTRFIVVPAWASVSPS